MDADFSKWHEALRLRGRLGGVTVEQVRALRRPRGIPLLLEAFQGGLVGNLRVSHGRLQAI